jgi:DNA-binding MarR family transcriptional regulator
MKSLEPAHDLAWFHLVTAHAKAVAAISAELAAGAGHGILSLEHYDVLLALKRSPDSGRLRLSELADSVVLSRSGLTRMVDRLEQAGLLRREVCPTDRRGAFAVLTREGAAALRRTWPEYARAIEKYFARFVTQDEATVIAKALGKVMAGLCGAEGKC